MNAETIWLVPIMSKLLLELFRHLEAGFDHWPDSLKVLKFLRTLPRAALVYILISRTADSEFRAVNTFEPDKAYRLNRLFG